MVNILAVAMDGVTKDCMKVVLPDRGRNAVLVTGSSDQFLERATSGEYDIVVMNLPLDATRDVAEKIRSAGFTDLLVVDFSMRPIAPEVAAMGVVHVANGCWEPLLAKIRSLARSA